MSVRVLFFGSLAERLRLRERRLDVPAAGMTLEQLKVELAREDPDLLTALAPPVRAAVDRTVAVDDTRVHPGQEVAFFPLVSGG